MLLQIPIATRGFVILLLLALFVALAIFFMRPKDDLRTYARRLETAQVTAQRLTKNAELLRELASTKNTQQLCDELLELLNKLEKDRKLALSVLESTQTIERKRNMNDEEKRKKIVELKEKSDKERHYKAGEYAAQLSRVEHLLSEIASATPASSELIKNITLRVQELKAFFGKL